MSQEEQGMDHRGLLTDDDRRFFRGERDVKDPAKKASEIRYRVRRRMENLEEDIQILREADETRLVEEFYEKIGRYERLERQIEELQQRLDDGD